MPPHDSGIDRSRLLLVVDVAGALHCYCYVVHTVHGFGVNGDGGSRSSISDDDDDDEPMAVLTHLWSRGAVGQERAPADHAEDDTEAKPDAASPAASPTTAEAGLGGFQCSLSKQLRRLQANTVLPALHAAAATTPVASPTSPAPSEAEPVPLAAAPAPRPGRVSKATTAAAMRSGTAGAAGAAALCPFCASTASSASSLASSRGPRLGRATGASSPGLSGVSRDTVTPSPSPSRVTASSTSAHDRPATSSTTSGAGEEPLFRPGDFMARVPEVPVVHSAAGASATSLDEGRGVAGGAPLFVPAAQVGGPPSEVGWYWRCPRSMVDACETTTAPHDAASDGSTTAAHVWVPLSEAVRQWNVLCCHHHRLLLLRHMEEQYTELDLLTGQPQQSVELTAAVVAAAAAAPLDGTASGASSSVRSRSWSSASAVGTSDRDGGGVGFDGAYDDDDDGGSGTSSTEGSSASGRAPRAVLSLTAQRYQTLLMQASFAPVSSATATAKRSHRSGHRLSAPSPTAPQAAAHTCLAKFAAPAMQLSLTWHTDAAEGASTPFTMTSADESSGDGGGEEKWQAALTTAVAAEDAAGAAAAHAQPHVTRSSSSSSSSTSTSDIDMDVLAGRKRLPVQYRFARPVTSTSSSTSSDAAGGPPRGRSSRGNASANSRPTHAAATTRSSTVPRRPPKAPTSSALDDIPLRCGPDGCVYGVSREAAGGDGVTSADETDNEIDHNRSERNRASQCSTHAGLPPMLLLQLPVPVLEAFWIVLPPPAEGAAARHSGAASWPLALRRVPWLPRDARTLRAVESSGAVEGSAGGAAAASAPGQLPALTFAGGLATVRGFVLQIDTTATTPDAAKLAAQCPPVLRPLSAYDVLGARVLCDRQRGARRFGSRSGGAGAKPRGTRPSVAPSASAERDRPLGGATAAAVQAEGHRLPHTNSSTSSFLGGSGSSITHRISPPPHRFVPATSFFDENFEPLALLGRGVGGAALLARHRVTGVLYAVKVLVARDYESERDILQEMRVHAMLDNRHVVRYHACWSEVISATRAQQLAFIGVCDAHEAAVPRRRRIDSSASSPASHSTSGALRRRGPWRSRKASAQELTEAGAGLRSAPGGWHHLLLPSHANMMLIGSESASESATPKVTQRGLARPQLRGNTWSTAMVDECASDTATASESGAEAQEERARATDLVSTAPPSAPRAPSPGGTTTRAPMGNGNGRARRRASTASSSGSSAFSGSSGHRKGRAWPSTGADGDEVGTATGGGGGGGGAGQEVVSRWGNVQWNSGADDDSQDGASTDSASEPTSPQRRDTDANTTTTDGERRGGTVIGSRVVFLQMELCQVTLAQYLASRTAVDRVENLIILLQIIAGLRYLHQRGILHRDLKPTNVFMDYRCQYDDTAHHTSSSSCSSSASSCDSSEASSSTSSESSSCSSSSGDGSRKADVRGGKSFPASPVVRGPAAEAGALALCRRHPGVCPPPVLGGAARAAVLWPPPLPHHRTSPGTLAAAAATTAAAPQRPFPTTLATTSTLAGASLDNLPAWDGERAALDVVMHAPHRTGAEMLEQRLQRRPPPPRVLAAWTSSSTAAASRANGAKLGSPPPSRTGRRFLRRLAGWLRHRLVQVRLGDFGLAKLIYQQDLGLDGFMSMNASNTVGVGSPLYASPEQLKGSRCTAASDVFSLGVVLAEMYLQPKTIAERLTVLREVRDGVYRDGVLLARYPELKLVRRLTAAQPERRMTLKAVHHALAAHLTAALHAEVRDQYE